MNRFLIVMLGAALGGGARYALSSAIFSRYTGRLPMGTIIVNITGCFLIGILLTLFIGRGDPNPNLRLFLVTGLLGGYTTFSSFAWESFDAIENNRLWIGLANIALSVVLGCLAVWLGSFLTRAMLVRGAK